MNMIDYINAENCRSGIIGNYFGDAEIINCDICDNCTEKKLQKKFGSLIVVAVCLYCQNETSSFDKFLKVLLG